MQDLRCSGVRAITIRPAKEALLAKIKLKFGIQSIQKSTHIMAFIVMILISITSAPYTKVHTIKKPYLIPQVYMECDMRELNQWGTMVIYTTNYRIKNIKQQSIEVRQKLVTLINMEDMLLWRCMDGCC